MSFGFGFGFPSWRTLAGGFSPAALFVGGVQGAWYDPSDLSTMFDSSAGTTPVAMPGLGAAVPVGLMLDKSQGLVLGPNLAAVLPTPTILDSGGSVGVWDGSTQTISSTTITAITNYPRYQFAIVGVTAGKNYQISVTATGTNLIRISNPSLGGVVLTANFASGTLSFIANNVASNVFQLVTDSRAVYSATLAVSIRELPGNHAIAFNNLNARPVLMARVNLLTYSEEFDNAAWTKTNATVTTNTVVAPDGTLTADALVEDATTNNHVVQLGSLGLASGTYVASMYVRPKDGRNYCLFYIVGFNGGQYFDLTGNGSVLGTQGASPTAPSITPVANGFYRIQFTFTGTATNFQIYTSDNGTRFSGFAGNGSTGLYIWGADLRPANIGANVPAYQRIADANTYDTSGFPLYLRFDGIDDSMYTPANLNLSGTDKVAVFAGVRKNVDSGLAQIFAELTNGVTNRRFTVVQNTSSELYAFASGGDTLQAAATNASVYAAPVSNVLTGVGDIAGDIARLRLNGSAISTSTGDQGTGNYSNAPLYIGARNNSSFWLNGHLHSLIIAGSAVSAGNISATEQWVAGKTGIAL